MKAAKSLPWAQSVAGLCFSRMAKFNPAKFLPPCLAPAMVLMVLSQKLPISSTAGYQGWRRMFSPSFQLARGATQQSSRWEGRERVPETRCAPAYHTSRLAACASWGTHFSFLSFHHQKPHTDNIQGLGTWRCWRGSSSSGSWSGWDQGCGAGLRGKLNEQQIFLLDEVLIKRIQTTKRHFCALKIINNLTY